LAPSEALIKELEQNEACKGLCIINPPKWLKATIEPEKIQSSVIFSFLDKDSSHLACLVKSPLFLFGSPCKVDLFSSLLLVCQCECCHRLRHLSDYCCQPKGVVICPICGQCHVAKDHAFQCPTSKNHTTYMCSYPPQYINCQAASHPAARHMALDLLCPLYKKFRCNTNYTSSSSEEDVAHNMVIDASTCYDNHIPSLQPSDDKQTVLCPTPLVQVDTAPCLPSSPPLLITTALADITKWARLICPPSPLPLMLSLPLYLPIASPMFRLTN